MAKRFFDTKLFNEDWFLEMPIEYKLFWFYILSDCDHSGIYKVNLRSFCGLNEVKLTSKQVIEYINNGKQRIRVISDSVWLIEDFFFFQYGSVLNMSNRVHKSISEVYEKYKIELTSIRGLIEVKEGVKDKDNILSIIDNKKDKEKEITTLNQVRYVYGNSDYEHQSEEIKKKFSKEVFDSYLNFLKLFKGKESKVKYHDFPLLSDYFEDLYKKFTFDQISKGVTTMFGYQIATDAHLISRIITCIGFGIGNGTFKPKTEDINSMNELSDYDKAKLKMGGNQSFRKKDNDGANN